MLARPKDWSCHSSLIFRSDSSRAVCGFGVITENVCTAGLSFKDFKNPIQDIKQHGSLMDELKLHINISVLDTVIYLTHLSDLPRACVLEEVTVCTSIGL